MGEDLKREFTLNPIDTGRRTPDQQVPQQPSPINPMGLPQMQPGAPIVRPSYLQAFLANLPSALAGGLHSEPGAPFGTGLSGALQNIEEQRRYNSQLGLQQQSQQRLAQQQASTQALQQAELSRLQQLTPLEVREKNLNADIMQAQIGFYSNPSNLDSAVSDATKSFGKLDPTEQAQIDAAKKDAQLKRSFDPLSAAVGKIAQDRFQLSKADETSGYSDYKNDPTIDPKVKNKNRATFLAWKARQQPAATVLGNMIPTGNALDQQAELYYQTHELPAGFARSPGTTSAIIKRAAELHPEGNLAGNQASFKADQESLKKLQSNFDQVTAFENTAIKNLDQVSKAMAQVPELNSRLANTPVRAIDAKVLGTPQMARLRAALLTASKESAKVLQSANASGVLSDEASREAQAVLDGSLPAKSMQAAIDQLKTDFGNRHQSYQDAINAIKARMGGKSQPSESKRRVIDLTGP